MVEHLLMYGKRNQIIRYCSLHHLTLDNCPMSYTYINTYVDIKLDLTRVLVSKNSETPFSKSESVED